MGKREAIKEAERWIANYRIPSQVLKSRAFKQFIADGKWINFGRYTYGKWKAIGEMAKGLATGSPKDRMDALGKVVAAGVAGLILYPMLDALAKKVTGNENARFSRGGELTPADDLTAPGKSWVGRMSGFMSMAPFNEALAEGMSGHEFGTGRNIVEPMSSPAKQGIQAGEWAASRAFYPAQEVQRAMGPGGPADAAGQLVGLNLPQHAPGQMKGKTTKYLRSQAKRREKSDPLEQ